MQADAALVVSRMVDPVAQIEKVEILKLLYRSEQACRIPVLRAIRVLGETAWSATRLRA